MIPKNVARAAWRCGLKPMRCSLVAVTALDGRRRRSWKISGAISIDINFGCPARKVGQRVHVGFRPVRERRPSAGHVEPCEAISVPV